MTTLAIAAATSLAATAQARDGAMVDVIQDDATGTVLQYEFAAPTLKQVRIGNETAVIVQLGDESINGAAGEPAIADVRRSITIGPDARVAATFMGGEWPTRPVRKVQLSLEGAPIECEDLMEVTQLNPTLLSEMTVPTRELFLEVYYDDIQDVYSEVMATLQPNGKCVTAPPRRGDGRTRRRRRRRDTRGRRDQRGGIGPA